MNIFKKSLLLLLFTAAFSGCYDNVISSIPDYPVRLQLNLTTTYPTFRNSVNQYLLFEKRILATDYIGFGGILVYTGFDGEYYAFDMACPYEAKNDIKVYPNDLGQAVCKKCGTVFDIDSGVGNPSSGPAKEVLKRYRTSLSGDVLYISR
ncbi:MAG: hypothetical protein Q7U47_02205 [Paludibacter sp.]|nr:hypothetical protein [Paludibacter sp.]